jgi:hypothetical protein
MEAPEKHRRLETQQQSSSEAQELLETNQKLSVDSPVRLVPV